MISQIAIGETGDSDISNGKIGLDNKSFDGPKLGKSALGIRKAELIGAYDTEVI